MNTLVSIITPSYNSQKFIQDAIDSVLSQTYQNWEMIIVDDVSSDRSNDIIEEYIKKDNRIKLIKLAKNSGPSVARNKAIHLANGRYIAFLDSDDCWHSSKLTKQLSFMQEQDIALSYTGYYRIKEESGEIIDQIHVPKKVDYNELLKQNIIGCLTAIYDTHKIGKIYMPDIFRRQDFGLWLKILKKVPYAYGMLEPLASYRVRTSSVSSNKILASKYNWKL
ncbi:MAG: glycosyltransferase family 2 protein, partial [Bacteroidales bacterium]|nr:glycosyltransferase family 2 protein [Bacteroidales bacterium]